MITQQRYYAAGTVAPRVHAHLLQVLASTPLPDEGPRAALPTIGEIETLVDAAFWASLRREEGYEPQISLAFLSPEETAQPLRFERHLSLDAAALAKVAPAVAPAGIHLGVWRTIDGLVVWGTTRTVPVFCLVVEVVAPGLLVIKHRRQDEGGKFANVAVLEGDRIKVVDERASNLPECPPLLTSLLGFDTPGAWGQSVHAMVRLAVAMRAHGRGGAMLVVPAGSDTWRESVMHPMSYAVMPPFTALTQLLLDTSDAERDARWRAALDRAVESVAHLTAVDGATILTDRFELLAFGAKIVRRDGAAPIEQIVVTEPIEGAPARHVEPMHIGGTRHLSAAQFVQDQQTAAALVASQDGRFTVFAWSACDAVVRAHRVETLLL